MLIVVYVQRDKGMLLAALTKLWVSLQITIFIGLRIILKNDIDM